MAKRERLALSFPGTGDEPFLVVASGNLGSATARSFASTIRALIKVNAERITKNGIILDLCEITQCDDEGARAILLASSLVNDLPNAKPLKVLGADVIATLLKANGSSKVLDFPHTPAA